MQRFAVFDEQHKTSPETGFKGTKEEIELTKQPPLLDPFQTCSQWRWLANTRAKCERWDDNGPTLISPEPFSSRYRQKLGSCPGTAKVPPVEVSLFVIRVYNLMILFTLGSASFTLVSWESDLALQDSMWSQNGGALCNYNLFSFHTFLRFLLIHSHIV